MNSGLNVMLDLNRLHGIFPPILTPMNDDESPDLESLASLIDFLIGNGVHGKMGEQRNHRRIPLL